jgi:hypothetical protein
MHSQSVVVLCGVFQAGSLWATGGHGRIREVEGCCERLREVTGGQGRLREV